MKNSSHFAQWHRYALQIPLFLLTLQWGTGRPKIMSCQAKLTQWGQDKMAPFCRHYEINFSKWKLLYTRSLIRIFTSLSLKPGLYFNRWQSLTVTRLADSRTYLFIHQLSPEQGSDCRQQSPIAVFKFNNVKLSMQSLALSIQSAGCNSIYKVTGHADLKNTHC